MAVNAAQVVVSTSAVALNAAETDPVGGTKLFVKNTHATDALVLGGSGVTAGAGFALAAGQTLGPIELSSGEQMFGIRGAAADITAHVLRLGA